MIWICSACCLLAVDKSQFLLLGKNKSTASSIDFGASFDFGSMPCCKHCFIKMASIELVTFSTRAAIGLDCWFSIIEKFDSLPPIGYQFSCLNTVGLAIIIA